MGGQVIDFPLKFHPEPGVELVLGSEGFTFEAKTARLHLGSEIWPLKCIGDTSFKTQ